MVISHLVKTTLHLYDGYIIAGQGRMNNSIYFMERLIFKDFLLGFGN